MKKIKEFIEQATTNVNEDRAATKVLLMSLMKYMQSGSDRHKEVGLIAAKYLETLQRSNEQLVKIAAIIQKRESKTESISDSEVEELFDLINDSSAEEQE